MLTSGLPCLVTKCLRALCVVLLGAGLLALRAAETPAAVVHVVIPAGEAMPVAKVAIERLRDYAGGLVRVSHGAAATASSSSKEKEALVILLGSAGDSAELRRLWAAHSSAKPDSYLIKTIAGNPTTVVASGIDARGTLYAAYQLADRLKAKSDLTKLDIFRQPRIAERFVSFGATTYGRRQYVPELHWKTVKELPAFGYNGMIIYPGGGTPIGRRASPVIEAEDGTLRLEAENTAQWRAWFAELKRYPLDLMMTIPPVVPSGYTKKAIADYYAGGPEPRGYLAAVRSYFRRYVELVTTAYPEADRFMFNSTEGATFGRNERFFGHPAPERFPVKDYLQNNEAVMRTYFDVLAEYFADRRDRVYFWTHSFGLTSDGVAKMREILFSYPWVTIIEDDFWNNNLWPHDLPAMAYLPPDLRARVSKQNPFALFQIATDGEFHGGGSLPNAYPGSHIRTAQEALARQARMVIQRLDLHDRTPYGTAFGTMKIVPYAASAQLWDSTPSEATLWREWATTRFGPAAADAVIAALQESHTVLVDGFSGNGLDLLCVGSEFQPRLWMKDQTGVTRFFLFGRPGQPLVKKKPGEAITSGEYTAWQMGTRSLAIGEFRQRQDKAAEAVQRGLRQIESVRAQLSADDYAMLRDIFVKGEHVLRAVRLLGETAYATNLVLDNFDREPDPRRLFEQRAGELEAFLQEKKLIPEMLRNLATILHSYRELVAAAK